MPNWNDVLATLQRGGSNFDLTRRRFLKKLSKRTGRNTIVYYSGFLQKPDLRSVVFSLNDADKTGFMSCINGLDRTKGLDLVLHTPGGDAAATESIVDYLRSMFGTNIRAIVPEIAMSAGTVIACATSEILMGKHSSLGPIDPQIGGLPAHGVIEEFTRARDDITQRGPVAALVWQPILAKYAPTFIGECEKALQWTKDMVRDWLISGMFQGEQDAPSRADKVVSELADHVLTKSHARHISIDDARQLGLKVKALEDDQKLQDTVLSVHHSCVLTLASTPTLKIIENQDGAAFITQGAQIQIVQPAPQQMNP